MIRNKKIDQGYNRFSPEKSALLVLNYFLGIQGIYAMIIIGIGFAVAMSTNLADLNPAFELSLYVLGLVSTVLIAKRAFGNEIQIFIHGRYKRNEKEKSKAYMLAMAKGQEFQEEDLPKQNVLGKNILKVLKWSVMTYIFQIVCNFIIMSIIGQGVEAGNQAEVVQSAVSNPYTSFFMIVIFAPIVEELVFRGALYQSIRSEKRFYAPMLLSMIVFGSIHVLPSFMATQDPTQLIFLITYCGIAFFMIGAYEDTGSIVGAMGVHFINNLIAFLLIFLT